MDKEKERLRGLESRWCVSGVLPKIMYGAEGSL